jgi:hypothetical protein
MSNRKHLTIIGIFVGVVGIFFVAVLYPLVRGIVQDRAVLFEHEQALARAEQDERHAFQLTRVADQRAQGIAYMQALFVNRESPVQFFRFLDDQAARFQLTIEKAASDPVLVNGDSWDSAEVRIIGEGTYHNALSFLQGIEYAPYLSEVTDFSIRDTNKGIAFLMTIKFFVQ